MANKILNQFIDYYGGLSEDAKEIVRELVFNSSKQSKSQPPARPARAQSQSRKTRGLPSAPSTETVTVTVPAAHSASGGD